MNETFALILIGLLGLLSGFFVNYIIEWFYIRRNFLEQENVQEISEKGWFTYIFSPWSISTCPTIKRFRIIFLHFLFIALAIWLWIAPPPKVAFWWGFGWLVYFIIVIVMDLEYRVVLHPISIAGAVLGLAFGIWFHGLVDALIGGIVGFGVMYVFYLLGGLYIRWQSKRRGEDIDEIALGFGDVNIAGVIGLILGWPGIVLGLVIAILTGGAVSILYLLFMVITRRLKAFSAIPYAPFLILSTFILLYFRVFLDQLVN
ncbi:MAG: A24 family peptidase [Anaerolineales bacterium]|jgi:leader peptidase (prepilin peptidase)/N-methyltransferase